MPRQARSRAVIPPLQPGAAASPVTGAAAIDKALDLLDRIAHPRGASSFTALAAQTGLPRSTLHRLLAVLEARGLVRRVGQERSYHLGLKLLELAHVVWSEFDLRSAAEPELDRLVDATGETIQLAILDGDASVVLDGRAGPQAILHATGLGSRALWWETAAGWTLVAHGDPRELRSRVGAAPGDPGSTRARIDLARGRGYALECGGDDDAAAAVAAPVLDLRGVAIGALAVIGPRYRLPERRLHALAPVLIAAARRASHNAGGGAMTVAAAPAPEALLPQAHCVLASSALLGEAPYWDAASGEMIWVDMLAPSIHRFALGPGHRTAAQAASGTAGVHAADPVPGLPGVRETGCMSLRELVSVAVPRRAGGYLIASPSGIAFLDPVSGERREFVHPESGHPGNRYNDGKCDPRGRLWIGTMDPGGQPGRGSLLRVAHDGQWERVDSGFTVANGIAFSSDGHRLYFADSAQQIVWAYDCDPRTGRVGRRRMFVEFADTAVKPGGLAVDAGDGLWIAVWNGWRVERYDADGRRTRSVGLPVPRPTSLAFGGAGLDTLFVTTARVRLDTDALERAPLSGGLFAFDPGTAGTPVFPFGG